MEQQLQASNNSEMLQTLDLTLQSQQQQQVNSFPYMQEQNDKVQANDRRFDVDNTI